jgi:hypothetical protein
MATGQDDAIRAIVSCLHSAPAVDVASAISAEETLQMLSKWAGELERSLAQHTEVRNGLAADCNFLHKQFEDTLQSLGIRPADLTAVTLSATVQKLAALVQNASHTWSSEVVEAEPGGAGDGAGGGGGGGGGGAADADAADGAGAAASAAAGGRTFTFPVQATGLLKLVLRNTAEQHRYAPTMMGFRAAGADVAVQVHRLYTREDGVEEKLKVSYKHSVGHSRWHRMLNSGLIGALFKADSEADAHNKSDSDASGTDSLHLSKRLKVEEAHTYLLNARPGDVFVCHVRPMPGSVAVEVSAEFIDMKLADALAQLHSAASVFSSHALAEIGTIVQKIAAVQQLAVQCRAFTDRVAKQEVRHSLAGEAGGGRSPRRDELRSGGGVVPPPPPPPPPRSRPPPAQPPPAPALPTTLHNHHPTLHATAHQHPQSGPNVGAGGPHCSEAQRDRQRRRAGEERL